MHEMSLVRSLIRQVDLIAAENGGGSVREVSVEIGPLSGVESELVQSAFDQVIAESHESPMTLTIRETPLVVHCLQCEDDCEIDNFIFRCLRCGSGHVRVIRGDEFRIASITLDERVTHA
ncbi:hydrogenase maturation nickel metallochaperone HypA/HybF [Aporhodopirellula aestuarii]|uniref:Hydrogenase maturation factor HypA n=1 Tax=Aporhodopirellula aestuarii TaxID=2950107 RepID=A0ABT0TYU1_9BACT|nr:hydrogenase maturation nickel metallochaperone HypA [Aporhodopirellula aestuarii]MCM2369700.1 hydrogenase maturation nickel metallochaperone HypA [Aporhodopirellula aestuarii]